LFLCSQLGIRLGIRLERATRAAAAFATVSPKRSSLLKFFVAAFIDGDRCLTDLAAKKNFRCKRGAAWLTSRSTARVGGEGSMPRADRSITILTGMIIAALYVILLVGFTQESYMRRDAASRLNGAGDWTAIHDVSKRVCRIERPVCAEAPPNLSEPGQEPEQEALLFDNARIPPKLGHRSTTERR
jgi:hypothetical protein